MIYGSVCSGIEAASLAWEPLGWKPAWFAEIEPFPSAVLAHHWPHVNNLGDMTKIATAVLKGDVVAPDILVGGTPCQAFSVAGARQGLADDRGFLTIKYVELANAIDQKRAAAGAVPCITVWENVPGVLSSKDNAFGAFLGLLAGEDCELIPPGKKWENAGCVLGPQRAIAWRVLDAQYFGVAQRRRRVFVVASAREGFDPAKVLFECEGVRRDSAPSREAGKAVAALTANGIGTCGADDNQGQAGLLIAAFGQNNTSGPVHVSHALNAHSGPHGRLDFESETFLVQSVHGTQDPDTNVELAHTLGRNQGQENAVLLPFDTTQITSSQNRSNPKYGDPCHPLAGNAHAPAVCITGDITHTLKAEGFDTSEDGTGRGQPIVPVAFSSKDYGGDATENMSPTLRAGGHAGSHANAGCPPAVAYGLTTEQTPKFNENCALTLTKQSPTGGGQPQACMTPDMAVRRLTPVECERLQGFPDNHTMIPAAKRNKLIADELAYLRRHFPLIPEEEAHRMAADGPRYKAIGNSMNIESMEFIGRRIERHLSETGLCCADEEAA
ncbi:DNA cytosine methyltransferase [Aeromonas salmonicida]|uniref:DNA cytosine methyltransferase n=1 Tax=Aeromonas salmonicida TaxID=645 RepID=UPI00201101EE|nr:DNA cytosine methyltransferase [Aeromonas salmonicida]